MKSIKNFLLGRTRRPTSELTPKIPNVRFQEQESTSICYPDEKARLKYNLTNKTLNELRDIYSSLNGNLALNTL